MFSRWKDAYIEVAQGARGARGVRLYVTGPCDGCDEPRHGGVQKVRRHCCSSSPAFNPSLTELSAQEFAHYHIRRFLYGCSPFLCVYFSDRSHSQST